MNLFPLPRRKFLSATLALLSALAVPALAAETHQLTVMTYNVRVPLDKPPYTWPERRDAVMECIRSLDPDLIGTQEGIKVQHDDIAMALPEYVRIGQAREGGDKGEYSAILYRKDRFTVVEQGDFWLSDSPEVAGSFTWGNTLPRMVTWARLRDQKSGREFVWFNTHFDHKSQPSREKSAELLLKKASQVDAAIPVLITGDFNANAGENKAYEILTKPGAFTDTWTVAKERQGEGINSFNGFAAEPVPGGKRIDWVLFRGPFTVKKTAVVHFRKDGRFPSYHFPFVTWLEY
jgi:endonuclease/exonuclease/phosphatase family metal-dependent hydrolase